MTNPFRKYLTIEDLEHIKVVDYIKENISEIIAFHVPNEGKKSNYERYKYSMMGALKGCPDFVFMFPKYKKFSFIIEYYGLFIELKAPEHKRIVKKGIKAGKIVKSKGKLSDAQKDILTKLNKIGYKAVCCFGADEAINTINDYFKDYFEFKQKLNFNNLKNK